MAKKEQTPKTKVYLTDDLYFVVETDSFTLIDADVSRKRELTVGYFTQLPSLIKRATQVVISRKGNTISMSAFLEQWNDTQKQLLNKINI